MRPPFYKRRYFVSGFQYRLIYGNFLYLITTVFVFFVAIFGPVIVTLGNNATAQDAREVAARQLLVLHERVWYAVPIIIVLCVLHSVAMSHRIAGPLHRFKQVFKAVGDGDLRMTVRIRRNDYLQREAETVSEMISRMAEKVGAIHDSFQQANKTLPELMAALGREGGKETAVLAGKLGTQLDVLGQRIGQFQIPRIEQDERYPVATPAGGVALKG